jgi:hypothetical protein
MTKSFCPANNVQQLLRKNFVTALKRCLGGNIRCRQLLGWKILLKKKDVVNKSSLKLIESMPFFHVLILRQTRFLTYETVSIFC